MNSKPLGERLKEVTWTVYAIFKCAGRVSCTLEMQRVQVRISRKWQRRLSPRPLRAFTSVAPKPNLLTAWLSALTCISPFNLGSSVLTWARSSGPISGVTEGKAKSSSPQAPTPITRERWAPARHVPVIRVFSFGAGAPLGAEKQKVRGRAVCAGSSWIAQYSIWAELHEEINTDTTYLSTYAIWHCTRKIPSDVSHSVARSNRLSHRIQEISKLKCAHLSYIVTLFIFAFLWVHLFGSAPLQTPFTRGQKRGFFFLKGKKWQQLKGKWL